jgi:hypothetical protein
MKKLMAVGLAGALAAASVGTPTSSAQASEFGAFVVGALVGAGIVAYVHHYHPFNTVAYGFAGGHEAWCQAHYRSYNPATDSYVGYDGLAHRCVSPY